MIKKISNVFIELGIILLIVFPPIIFGAVWPRHIHYIQVIILSIGVAWTIKTFSRGSFHYPADPVILPMLCLTAWGGVNYLMSIYAHNTEREIYQLAFYCLLFFLVVQQLRTVRRVVGLAFIIVLIGSGESLFGIFQYLQGATTVLGHSTPNIGTVNATYLNHNHFAGFLILVIPVALGLILSSSSLEKRFFIFLLIGVMGAALVLSLSRGGLFSFFSAIAVMTLCLMLKHSDHLRVHWRKYIVGMLLLTILVTAGVTFIGMSPFAHRSLVKTFLPSRENFEEEIRFSIWRSALGIVKEFPLFGSGLGTFEYVFPRYRTPKIPQDSQPFYAHNDYLELLTEMGFPAIFIVFWGIFRVLRYVLRGYFQYSDPVLTALALGGLTSITALLIHSFWDFNLQIPANALLFVIILAMTIASVQLMERGRTRTRRRRGQKTTRTRRNTDSSSEASTFGRSYNASWLFLACALCIFGVLAFHFRSSLALRYYSKGRTFQNQQQYFPAIPWYHKALSFDGSNAMFHEHFGQLYTELARQVPHADKWYNLAISQFQQAIKLNNYHAAYYSQLGWSYAALNMEQDAIEHFKKAIAYDPKISFYYEQLGNYYLSLNLVDPSINMYQQALQYHPKRLKDILESFRTHGLEYDVYQQVVPEFAETRKYFADLLAAKKEWSHSKVEYRRAIGLSGDDPAYYDVMLEACRRQRDEQCRQELWQNLWEREPEKLDYPLLIAESLEKHQQEEKALELYQQLLLTHPEFEQGYWRLAELYQKQGEPEKALDIYMQLLEQRPEHVKIYHRLAELYSRQDKQRAAIEIYEQALQTGIDDTRIHFRLGTLYLQEGQKTQARKQYEYAVQKGEAGIELYRQLECLYQEQGNELGAELVWENYTLTNKHQPENLFKLVKYYHEQGEWLKAVTLVKEVIAHAPTKINYRKFLAILYEEEGMIEETIAQYRRILRIQPNNPDAKKQLSRLEG